MAYCTSDDVQGEIQTTPFRDADVGVTATRPSLAQVVDLCDQVSAGMDAVFQGLGATVPLATADASIVSWLKTTAIFGVVSRVYLTAGNSSLEKSKLYSDWFDGRMDEARANPKILFPGVGLLGPSSPSSTFPDIEDTDRPFQREVVQW